MDLSIRFYQINLSNSLRGYLIRVIKKNNYKLNNENMIKNFKAKQIINTPIIAPMTIIPTGAFESTHIDARRRKDEIPASFDLDKMYRPS